MKLSISARSPLSPTLWPPDAFRWWRSLGLAVLLVLATVVPATIFDVVVLAAHAAPLAQLQTLSWPTIIAQFIAYACILAVLVTALPRLARRPLAALGLRAPRPSDLLWGVGGAVAMVLVADVAGQIQQSLLHLKTDEVQVQMLRTARGSLVVGIALLACVAAPFVEEFVFRGFALNALLRYLPAWIAVVVSAILFGLVHFQPGNAGALIPLAAGGLVLAVVYYRSGSLPASMLTHALFNTLTVVAVIVFHQKG